MMRDPEATWYAVIFDEGHVGEMPAEVARRRPTGQHYRDSPVVVAFEVYVPEMDEWVESGEVPAYFLPGYNDRPLSDVGEVEAAAYAAALREAFVKLAEAD